MPDLARNDEAQAAILLLFVAAHGSQQLLRAGRDRVWNLHRQPQALQQAHDAVARLAVAQAHSHAQVTGSRQANGDSFAMPNAEVGNQLQRMAERMPQVQMRAELLLERIRLHHVDLDAHRLRDQVRQRTRAAAFQVGEEVWRGQDAVLDHFGQASAELGRRQGRQQSRVRRHQQRLLEGADQVFAHARQINPHLAADAGIHHGEQRGWHLDEGQTAQVGGRSKASRVAHHAAAERDDGALALQLSLRKARVQIAYGI